MKRDRTVLQGKRLGIYTCRQEDTLLASAHRMVDEDVSCLVVVDKEGFLVGILTRVDLLRAYYEQDDWDILLVKNYMVREVVTVKPQDLLKDVAHVLLDRQIHRVVVVQYEGAKKRPIAVISTADLVYHMVKEA